MKKQLLLGTALLAAMSAFPQRFSEAKNRIRITDLAERISYKYAIERDVNILPQSNTVKPEHTVQQTAQRSSSSITWTNISGSMNIFGVLVSNSKPLRYYPNLDAVSFVHRKSQYYNPTPAPAPGTPTEGISGTIVTMVSNDLAGTNWDSTAVWYNTSLRGRFPQGGLYVPPGSTALSDCYAVVTGPVVSSVTATGWIGNYFASKKLDVYNTTASTVNNAQQFIPNSSPFGSLGQKVDFARLDMAISNPTVTANPIMALGGIFDNVNATTFNGQNFTGARILKANFTAGVFNWISDVIVPPAELNSSSVPELVGQPHMAWNDDGTVGYVWFIGCRAGATLSNKGYQPIVFKTTNSGNTWNEIPGIDFNSGNYNNVLSRLETVQSASYKAPLFNFAEGMDGIVDANNRLHIVCNIISTGTTTTDDLRFNFFEYPNADGESYQYRHFPGFRPYIYDFTEGATPGAWNVTVIDSMSSESPGTRTNDNGYSSNPWLGDPTNNNDKAPVDSRLQLSRSQDGKYIMYAWTESDTNNTTSGFKWNNIPNLKVRLMEIGNNPGTNFLSPTELNLTEPLNGGFNANVRDRAHMFYCSPVSKVVTGQSNFGTYQHTVSCPFTVTNSSPLSQLTANTHWYSGAQMVFSGRPLPPPTNTIGVVEDVLGSVQNSMIYPNPTIGSTTMLINLKQTSKVNIKVVNLLGSVVKTQNVDAVSGDNSIPVDLEGLTKGIYMINISVGNISDTKKVVVE